MEGVPPDHREVDYRDIDSSYQHRDSASARTRIEVTGHPPDREVTELHHEQHRGGSESSVPCPPDSPGGSSPDRSSDERQRGEDDTHLHRRTGEPVPKRRPRPLPPPEESRHE